MPDNEKQTFVIKVEGNFIPTKTFVKQKLGTGFDVKSVEIDRKFPSKDITSVDAAVEALVHTGYRALVREHHPDAGGSDERMAWITTAKKQLDDLIKIVKA